MRLAAGDWSAARGWLPRAARGGHWVTSRGRRFCAAWPRPRPARITAARRSPPRRRRPACSRALGRQSDEALARYWLAYGTYLTDNEADARSQLQALLAQVRDGLQVEPEFEMRVLTALAAVESRVGEHAPIPGLPRGGARVWPTTSMTGAGRRSCSTWPSRTARPGTWRPRFGSASRVWPCIAPPERPFESATIENDLALAYLAMGNLERATEMATEAHRAVRVRGGRPVPGRGPGHRGADRARRGEARSRPGSGRPIAPAGPRQRQPAGGDGGAADRGQDPPDAVANADRGGEALRAPPPSWRGPGSGQGRLRELLGEWAELRAEAGDFQGAYELTSEAVRVN